MNSVTGTQSFLRILITLLVMNFLVVSIAPVCAEEALPVIKITAKKFEYSPSEIRIKKGVPVILEFTSADRIHGFDCPGLGIRTTIEPGKFSQVKLIAAKAGKYEFHCDVFCGGGHEDMTGVIIVED